MDQSTTTKTSDTDTQTKGQGDTQAQDVHHDQTGSHADDQSKGDDQQKGDDQKGKEQPKIEEKEYLDAIKKDENLLGKNDMQFDERLIKACIPAMQKYGISKEAANEMANAFAKAQLDGAKEMLKERSEYFAKMKGEATAKYSDSDFEQINAGIDHWFKPAGTKLPDGTVAKGIMNYVIRNSELGADPEFLALMHHLGASVKEDTGKGEGTGGGGGAGQPSGGYSGIAEIWK